MTLHLPPDSQPVTRPLIFLGGPIQGAADWQARAIALIAAEEPNVDIASPRRQSVTKGDFTEADYLAQVNWEHMHLDIASKRGVILFWLAAESVPIPGRSYAQTTRYELAEAVTNHLHGGGPVVIGIEKGFHGSRYIRLSVGKKAPDVPIVDSLEEACHRAVALARQIA
jgi:hypothetical protein